MLELPTRACLQSAVVLVDSESQCWHAHTCGRVTAAPGRCYHALHFKRGEAYYDGTLDSSLRGLRNSVACRKRCLLGTIDTSGQLELFPPTGDFRVTL